MLTPQHARRASQGGGAETGGVRGRRDAFGMTSAPGCRGPEAGADPGDLRVAVLHSSRAHSGSEGRDPLTEPRPRSALPTPRRRSAHAQTSLWATVRATRATCWPTSASPVPPAHATFLGQIALIKARACLGCWDGVGGELPARLAAGAPRGSAPVGNDEVALGGPGASGSWDFGAWQGLCGPLGWEVALRWT